MNIPDLINQIPGYWAGIIMIGYVVFQIAGFVFMGAVEPVNDVPSFLMRKSQRIFYVWIVVLTITGIPGIFGSLWDWLPSDIGVGIFLTFLFLMMIFPYWFAFDTLHLNKMAMRYRQQLVVQCDEKSLSSKIKNNEP